MKGRVHARRTLKGLVADLRKYYSAIMTDANYWTKEIDAEGYLRDIKECINKLDN